MIDESKPPIPERQERQTVSPGSTPADEPFACPACGQMLAASCRVCVVCKQPVDPVRVHRLKAPVRAPTLEIPGPRPLERARFSWQIFFVVLLAWLLTAGLTQRLLGPATSQWVLGGLVVLSSAWIFYDAQDKGIPKPLRWGLGSLLLWIVIFPWYLARRRKPRAVCPFIEAEASLLARALLFGLMLFFLVSIVLAILKGPLPK